ncbi:MAG: LPS export ABC transporter periplasmic protein LptC [Bacteroidales bacterium]|nr:LPS export ABC transporter periplasmic protein LptC [Bacteroidales bacterium]
MIQYWIAAVFAVAILFVSCKNKMAQADVLNLKDTPVQTIEDMFAVQTRNGLVVMRVEASVMERYNNDTTSYETFPKGIAIYGYSDDGLLETIIVSDDGRHLTKKKRNAVPQEELWEAFGNVVIHNVLKQETMETDTLYWNQAKNEIYTDCYVKMYSPQGFLQGYGMRSDDHARNAILLEPFNGYGYTVKDSTVVVIDSVNFIGPLVKISK